jgi:putative membrane protein
MKSLMFLFSLLFLLVSANLYAQQERAMETEESDFLRKAVSGGKMEVELGKLAVERAASETVKQFGQKMVDDHSKANQELMQILNDNNINVSEEYIEKHQEHVQNLGSRSGTDFDRVYMRLMVEDHMEDVRAFEDAAQNHSDEQVRNWAERTLPVLRQHFDLARQINKMMGETDQTFQ